MTCPHCKGPTKEIPGFNETYTVCANRGPGGAEKTCDESEEVRKRRTTPGPAGAPGAVGSSKSSTPGSPATPDADGNVFGYGPWPHLFADSIALWPPGSKLVQEPDSFEVRMHSFATVYAYYQPAYGIFTLEDDSE